MPYDPQTHQRRSIRLPGFDYSQAGAYFVTIRVQEGECLLGEIVNEQMVLNDWGRQVDAFWQATASHFPTIAVPAFVTMPNHVHAIIILTDTPPPPAASGAHDAHNGRGEETSPRPSSPDVALPDVALPPSSAPAGSSPGPSPTWSASAGLPGLGEETSPLRWSAGDDAADTRDGRGEVSSPRPPSSAGSSSSVSSPDIAPPAIPSPSSSPTLGRVIAFYKYQTTVLINQARQAPGLRFWQRNYWEHVIRNDDVYARVEEYIWDNPQRWSQDRLHPDHHSNGFSLW